MHDVKKLAQNYEKVVYWSDEDDCYVGQCPELFGGGVHGDNEAKVYADLCGVVEDFLEGMLKEKRILPLRKLPAKFSGRFVLRMPPILHHALSRKALRLGKSLNEVCLEAIQRRYAEPTTQKSSLTR